MKSPIPNIKKYIPLGTQVIQPTKDSPVGLSVPLVVMEYGNMKKHFGNAPRIASKLLKSLFAAKKSYKSLKKNHAKPKINIENQELKELENYLFDLGVSKIGYTSVPEHYIFNDKVILYSHAIVITMEMKKSEIAKAPKIESGKEVWRTYAELGAIVNRGASFLREHGFNAQAGPAVGGEINYPLIAEKAGLGVIGKHGVLISPETGPSQRIAVIFTNIENLPYSDSNEHLWVRDFCETCNRCVEKCPGNAIYKETRKLDNGARKHIDYVKCAVPFSESMGCSVCIKECIFFKGDYDKLKKQWERKQKN